jgi:hypothetical protein
MFSMLIWLKSSGHDGSRMDGGSSTYRLQAVRSSAIVGRPAGADRKTYRRREAGFTIAKQIPGKTNPAAEVVVISQDAASGTLIRGKSLRQARCELGGSRHFEVLNPEALDSTAHLVPGGVGSYRMLGSG